MTRIEKLYQTIQNLKELGLNVSKELLEDANRIEEEIIKTEIIPSLAEIINPVISQIQREITLIVEYIPNEPEPLSVRITREKSPQILSDIHETEEEIKSIDRKTFTIPSHTKSRKTNLNVRFTDGKIISNRFAYQTLIEIIQKVGIDKVLSLKMSCRGIVFISETRDDFYSQHEIGRNLFVITQTSTQEKKEQLDEIALRTNTVMFVDIV